MCAKRTALVIGAGLGGIAVAARLAIQGFAVTVLEKNGEPGGRCGRLLRDGHRFDSGPTLLLMPEVFSETYAALGERLENHLDLRRVDPTYRIHFADGTVFAPTGDLPALRAAVEEIEPGSFDGVLRYLSEGCHHYRHALQNFVGRNFASLPAYLEPRNLWEVLFHLHALGRQYRRLGRRLRDPRLKAAFTFQDMYLGISPFDAPATYSLLPYTEIVGGVWFPMGGMYRVVESLVVIAEALGVRFLYNAPVAEISIEGGRAVGVVLADGTRIGGSAVVVNADLPYAYEKLLPEGRQAARLRRLRYTCSTIVFYWGVDGICSELGPHSLFLASDYRGSFERIFRDHALPAEPSFYVHAPARIDRSVAPPGKDTLYVLVPVGHLDCAAQQDWPGWQAQARSAVLRRLGGIGLADLERRLTTEIVRMPADWRDDFNLAKGAAFGLSHNVLQVGYLRPHNRHRRYGNLYFVGGSTHPGSGLPMVLLSARLTAGRLVGDLT